MRYRLRTLLILLALGPPLLAWLVWPSLERMIYPASKLEFTLGPVGPGDTDELIGVPIIGMEIE